MGGGKEMTGWEARHFPTPMVLNSFPGNDRSNVSFLFVECIPSGRKNESDLSRDLIFLVCHSDFREVNFFQSWKSTNSGAGT